MAPAASSSKLLVFLYDLGRPTHLLSLAAVYVAYRIIHRLILWPRYLSPLRHVPTPPYGGLIMGHSTKIINSESGIPQREWVKEYGPVVRLVGFFGSERLIFVHPEPLHQILAKDWLEYPRPEYLKHILGIVAGYGLLTVTGMEHRLMRRAMNPAFSIPNLTSQIHMYYDSIDGLIKILNDEIEAQANPADGKRIRVYEWMSKATLDIICETAFGYKADSLHNPENELAVAYENLLSLQTGLNIAKLLLLMLVPGMPRLLNTEWAYRHRHWFGLTNLTKQVTTLIDSMHTIKAVSVRLLSEKMNDSIALSDIEAKRDIMSLLVRARKADLEKDSTAYAMSDKAMVDQVLTFLGAGHETTASGLTWTLWLLANDRESQQKLREEATQVLNQDTHPDYRTLKELQWLDCVVMESLRVLPPVPMTIRTSTKSDYIGGVFAPKGTTFYIPIRVVNTYKGIWGEDAEEFRPSRWLNLPKEYHSNYSMLSFIAGPHGCIGKTMAIMEMKAVLLHLVANFTFEPAYEGQVTQPAAAITMKPTDGMPLLVKRVIR
ncbi:hypothetical protein AMATHDRAFT_66232 [Amanita thiersii Skay4041]|uniref:Cytochrome P450 n=1 Tax=Amanita thiersii Skay4041 TaxID=703135 RepID=A0A2A9NBX7_9AGAR|nr:hypothetical protein AMATHDRAFT_66232 [Amanita thiersii Skay4041]